MLRASSHPGPSEQLPHLVALSPVEQFPALERVSLHYQRDCLFVLVMMETQVHFALGAVVKQVHPLHDVESPVKDSFLGLEGIGQK